MGTDTTITPHPVINHRWFLHRRLFRTAAAILAFAALVVGTPSALADPVFSTMNDSGGIYWRSAPAWSTPIQQSGYGIYPGTYVSIHCYQSGTTVPGSANIMWVKASWAGGPGTGSGWVNEHFVNDGAPINQAAGGVPPCNGRPACHAASCIGLDPQTSGCSADAKPLETAPLYGDLKVELRWSPTCYAAWVRISGGGFCASVWGPCGAVVQASGEDPFDEGISARAAPGWSRMVSFTYWTRGCAVRFVQFPPPNYTTYVCTGWH
jgi:hypothetical protein